MVMLAGLLDTYQPLVLGLLGALSRTGDAKINQEEVVPNKKEEEEEVVFYPCSRQ